MMRGRDLLAVADALKITDGDAFQRSAVTRYYYAAFLELRSLFEERFGFNRKRSRGEHQAVINSLAPLNPKLAEDLRDLRTIRNWADYNLGNEEVPLSDAVADATFISATIIAWVDEWIAAHPDQPR